MAARPGLSYCVPGVDDGASFPVFPRMRLFPAEITWPLMMFMAEVVLPVMTLAKSRESGAAAVADEHAELVVRKDAVADQRRGGGQFERDAPQRANGRSRSLSISAFVS